MGATLCCSNENQDLLMEDYNQKGCLSSTRKRIINRSTRRRDLLDESIVMKELNGDQYRRRPKSNDRSIRSKSPLDEIRS